MTTANLDRRVSSGGAFGYYDSYPTGELPGTGFTASFGATFLHNTWIISKDIGAGSSVAVLFGPEFLDPSRAPTPNLFDVSLSFSGSISVYGVDVGSLSLNSDAITIEILGQTENYPSENLDALLADLLDAGVPQETAEDFVAVVDEAMASIGSIEAKAFEIYNSIDSVDFSAMDNLVSVDLTSAMATASETGTPVNIGAIINVIGSTHDDKLAGNAVSNVLEGSEGSDWISGGSGADQLFGGGADDFIFFDAEDTAVYGGAGRDVAVALGSDGVTINMAEQGLECVIGCDGADVITIGDGGGNLMAAGGSGSDTFFVSYGGGQGPRILWGSDDSDSDEFLFYSEGGSQLGLLIVTVEGLTTQNFSTFDLSMLNLPASFNWGAIDAVIINPDSNDKYYAPFDTSPVFMEYYGTKAINETLTATEEDVVWSGYTIQAVEGTSGALGATLHMQVPEYGSFSSIWYREKGDTATAWLNGVEYYDQGITDLIDDLTDEYGSPVADWSVDMSEFDGGGEGTGMLWFKEAQWTGGPDMYDSWFVAGGAMYGENLVASDAPHASMPENPGPSPFDWLLAA